MSGGAYDYISHQISEINVIRVSESNPRRLVFQEILSLVAKAMHDIEWVDSGDKSDGDENQAIDNVLNVLKIDIRAVKQLVKYKEIERLVNESNNRI